MVVYLKYINIDFNTRKNENFFIFINLKYIIIYFGIIKNEK